MADVISIITTMLVTATPIIYAMIGVMFAERSGVLNIGIEGIMLISASVGFVTTVYTGNIVVGTIAAIAVGTLIGLMTGVLFINLKCDQIISGISIWLLGVGLSGYIWYASIFKPLGYVYIEPYGPLSIPFAHGTPLGALLEYNWMVYGAIILVFVSFFVLFRTNFGLVITAVGDNPTGAETVGINVPRIRYICLLISGALGGLAGAFFTLGYTGSWAFNITSGTGFIAIAIVKLGRWNPIWASIGAFVFSSSINLQFVLQLAGIAVPYQVFQALPYVIGITLVMASSRIRRREPKSLGTPYSRE